MVQQLNLIPTQIDAKHKSSDNNNIRTVDGGRNDVYFEDISKQILAARNKLQHNICCSYAAGDEIRAFPIWPYDALFTNSAREIKCT